MPKVYAIDGIVPVVDPSAYVHPSAVLVGDVIVGPRAYIGPGASLRGDFGRIVVEEGANIQDTCMLHGFPGKDTVVGAESTIGHGAVLHGCVVERGALIGMNAVVNDNAVVGEDAMVAALAIRSPWLNRQMRRTPATHQTMKPQISRIPGSPISRTSSR